MVQAIPDERKGVIAHLVVEGGKEALEYYQKAFDAKVLFVPPEAPDGRLMHAEFEVFGSVMYLADDFSADMPEGAGYVAPPKVGATTVSPSVYVEDVDAQIAKAEAAGGTVVMPPMDMFWGDRYGQIRDPFGHLWSFSTHIKDLTEEDVAAAREEFEKSMEG